MQKKRCRFWNEPGAHTTIHFEHCTFMLPKRRFGRMNRWWNPDFRLTFHCFQWLVAQIEYSRPWKVLRKSGFHLLFLLPKSSFGMDNIPYDMLSCNIMLRLGLVTLTDKASCYHVECYIHIGIRPISRGSTDTSACHHHVSSTDISACGSAGSHARSLTRWSHEHDSVILYRHIGILSS